MTEGRERNGRFGQGNRANPHGRPRKSRSVNDTIMREMASSVTVTENQKRKRISKLAANAKQIANQGASGDFKAAKLSLELALKAETNTAGSAAPPPLTQTDREIVERFLVRLAMTQREDGDHVDAQP